jgi:hypothetical protein
MPARAANLIRVSVSTVGTGGPLAIGAAVTGFRALSVLPDGSFVNYAIEDTPGNETGFGTVSGGGTSLTRNFIDSSTGSALSLTGGAQLIVTLLARDLGEVHLGNHSDFGGI